MTEEVLVDALPYFDSGYEEPGVKQAALALIEEECRRYKPTKNYLDILGPQNLHEFETEIMKNEFARMEQRIPIEVLSMKRYELPPPSSGKQTEVSAWNECVENSYAQLEHQANRIINLELMSQYGSTSWRLYNEILQKMFDEQQKKLSALKKEIQNVNLQRKTEQTDAGEKLRGLEQNWVGLVSKNYEIECAIVELEKELVDLKRHKSSANNSMNLDNNSTILNGHDTEIGTDHNVETLTRTNDESTSENNRNQTQAENTVEDMPENGNSNDSNQMDQH